MDNEYSSDGEQDPSKTTIKKETRHRKLYDVSYQLNIQKYGHMVD